MIRKFIIAAAALLSLSASATIVSAASYSIDLLNSSEYVIELVDARSGRAVNTITPGRSVAFNYSSGVNLLLPDGRKLHYERVDPPGEFVRKSMFAASFKAQFSRDLRIWVVSPNGKRPALPPPVQPPGFPLAPR